MDQSVWLEISSSPTGRRDDPTIPLPNPLPPHSSSLPRPPPPPTLPSPRPPDTALHHLPLSSPQSLALKPNSPPPTPSFPSKRASLSLPSPPQHPYNLLPSLPLPNSPSSLPPPPPPSTSTLAPSSLFTTAQRTPPSHSPGALPGRPLPNNLPVQGYEPKDPIEVHDSEFTPTFFPRKTTRASTCNTTEDVEAPPYDLEADGSRNKGMLASPLCLQERNASADSTRVDYSNGDNSVSVFQLVHLLSKPVPGHMSR